MATSRILKSPMVKSLINTEMIMYTNRQKAKT